MNKTAKKILGGLGLAALGAVALSGAAYYVTERMLSLALDRDPPPEPRIKLPGMNLSGDTDKAAMDELTAMIDSAAAELMTHENETVSILSHDGLRLVGHYFPCEAPKRLLIGFHGWRSGWERDFAAVTPFWRENGCAFLLVEQRARGESEGEYMGFGLLERYDVASWAAYAMERFGAAIPTYLVGISMGAASVMMAADLPLPENIHGIMTDCGFTSPGAIWRHVAERNLHIPYGGPIARMADGICKKKIGLGAESHTTTAALAACRVPVFFLHGSGDSFVPIEMTYENYMACASPKRLVIAPGAGHGLTFIKEPALYKKSVLEFWKDFD